MDTQDPAPADLGGGTPESTGRGTKRRAFLGMLALSALSPVGVLLAAGRASERAEAAAPSAPSAAGDRPTRLRRWAMVIDLRLCDGCQSVGKPPQCTAACVEGHYAPEPMEWIETYEAPLPGGGTQFIPTPCQQCQNPPCVNVCPVAATFSTPEGVVLIDQERCIGCRICMEACPYDRRFFNWGEPTLPPETEHMVYSPEHQAPARKGTVMKCDFCPDMARAGRLPFCAQACPNNAIYFGDLEEDLATNGRDVVTLSRFLSANTSYRLKEHLGTQPRVFYVPGHGERVGRDANRRGRKHTQWPWKKSPNGGKTWTR
ncbi:MAG: 4Fe-4S dicluster domain-containing protein [Chloroflexota bacterium]|nr:MAG: 4Fe-4S dicluster domain-containing protein [Chloroflexota bacterium]